MSRARLFVAALVLGCAGPAESRDAGIDAEAPPPDAAITGPRYGFVGEETCFSVASGGEVGWSFGDGATAMGHEACHAYALVGSRTVGVVVTDARGRRAEATHSLQVVLRPSDPAPTTSATMAVDGARGRVWVVNPDASTVAVLSIEPLGLVREVRVGLHPRALAVSGAVVAVACQGDDTLWLVDAASLEARGIAMGFEPWAVLADPRGGAFYVASRAGTITSVDPAGVVLDAIEVGPEPRGLAMNGEGALLASRWRSGSDGARVVTVDARDPRALALGAETVLPPQVGLDSDTDSDGVLSFVGQAVPSPDGGRVILPALKANVVAGLFRTGEPLTSQTTARAALREVLFGAPGAVATESFRHAFDDLDFASAAVYSPMGDRLFVAMQGAQTVVVVDAFDFFTVASIDAVGEAPQGLALSPDGALLFVQAFLSRTVRVYDVSSFAREPALVAEIPTLAVEPLAAQVLDGKRVFYRSRDPRMSRTRYLACASCHLDGEGDGLVWDFTQRGEGLRNTIELRGRAGRGPLHWSANFDEVQDFEHDIRDGQGGEGFLADEVFHAMMRDAPLGGSKAGLSPELDALAAYVESLAAYGASPFRAVDDDAARTRGAAVFATLGCASCHAGAEYTDSALVVGEPRLHDVGTLSAGSGMRLGATLTGLDTPTLRGLWRTAPYLHDGSAATLRDVLTTRNAEDWHGVTSARSPAELDDLVAYLRALDDAAP